MIYYVKTGEVDAAIEAGSHRQAAVKALKDCGKGVGVCVMVNEEGGAEGFLGDSVFFLTQNILDECSMRVVN